MDSYLPPRPAVTDHFPPPPPSRPATSQSARPMAQRRQSALAGWAGAAPPRAPRPGSLRRPATVGDPQPPPRHGATSARDVQVSHNLPVVPWHSRTLPQLGCTVQLLLALSSVSDYFFFNLWKSDTAPLHSSVRVAAAVSATACAQRAEVHRLSGAAGGGAARRACAASQRGAPRRS